MTDQPGSAPLAPPGAEPEPQRPARPGLTVPSTDGTGAMSEVTPVAPVNPDRVSLRRLNQVMTEVWVDGALIGIAQATSTEHGSWAYRHAPGFASKAEAERAASAMSLAAVDAQYGR